MFFLKSTALTEIITVPSHAQCELCRKTEDCQKDGTDCRQQNKSPNDRMKNITMKNGMKARNNTCPNLYKMNNFRARRKSCTSVFFGLNNPNLEKQGNTTLGQSRRKLGKVHNGVSHEIHQSGETSA